MGNVNYGIKYHAYNFNIKPEKEDAVGQGKVSEKIAEEDLRNIRKRMYLPFPLDLISVTCYYNKRLGDHN